MCKSHKYIRSTWIYTYYINICEYKLSIYIRSTWIYTYYMNIFEPYGYIQII
jgi:hypothetical protein